MGIGTGTLIGSMITSSFPGTILITFALSPLNGPAIISIVSLSFTIIFSPVFSKYFAISSNCNGFWITPLLFGILLKVSFKVVKL